MDFLAISLCDPDREFGICILIQREHPNFQLNYWTGTAVGFRAFRALAQIPCYYCGQTGTKVTYNRSNVKKTNNCYAGQYCDYCKWKRTAIIQLRQYK